MKILAVHSALLKDPNKQSQVDHWRIYRPLRELAKHVDWQIDHEPSFIPGIEKYQSLEEFTPEEMEKAFDKISTYDVVFSSYHPDPTAFTLLKVAADRTGTQFIMDVDDDMFAINPDNPFWMKMDDEKVYWMQCMIRDNAWLSTTTEALAKVFRDRREHPANTVFINPNCIPDDYKHPEFDNGDEVVIGYFGGSSHYADLHETGVLEAVQRLMHENKKIRFKSIGMPVDTYIPRGRYHFHEGKRGTRWIDEVFPSLKMDIALAPLHDNIFNHGKSDIKWQEATRAGAALVASRIGPYAKLPRHVAALAMNDSDSWYAVIKKLVDDKESRKQLVASAQKELEASQLESNWRMYKEMFETVTKKAEAV